MTSSTLKKGDAKVVPQRIPQSLSPRCLSLTVNLLEGILQELGYNGGWTLQNASRIRKKSQEMFRAIRIASHGIQIRCKPGDNSTAWEYTLIPPKESKLDDILNELTKVHPRTLSVPKIDRGEVKVVPVADHANVLDKTLPPDRPIVNLNGHLCGYINPKTGMTCNNQAVEFAKTSHGKKAGVCAEHMLSEEWFMIKHGVVKKGAPSPEGETVILTDKFIIALPPKPSKEPNSIEGVKVLEQQKFENQIAELAAKVEPIKPVVENQISLKLPITGKPLVDDPQALDRALVATALALNKSGTASRANITDSIIKELDLEEFVKSSKFYNDLRSAIRAIMMGMVKRHWLKRIYSNSKNIKNASCVACVITSAGRNRIVTLMEHLNDDLIQRLWSGPLTRYDNAEVDEETFDEDEEEIEVPAQQPVATQSGPEPLDKISRNLQKLKPLMEQHDALAVSINEVDGVVAGLRNDKDMNDLAIFGTREKIKTIVSQIQTLQAEVQKLEALEAGYIKRKTDKELEIENWEGEKINHQNQLDLLLTQIKELMGG